MADTGTWERRLDDLEPAAWAEFLTAHSGLPGPRANLTLLEAAARRADDGTLEALRRDGGEFPVMCAAAGNARRAGDPSHEEQARDDARDERWRVREGVVIGLQLCGDAEPAALEAIVRRWAEDADPLVGRAAVAAICEPRLLRTPRAAAVAIEVCGHTTRRLVAEPEGRRRHPDVRTLRQALAYCWSVAVAADPTPGLAAFGALDTADPDVAWIVAQNLRKKRLSALV